MSHVLYVECVILCCVYPLISKYVLKSLYAFLEKREKECKPQYIQKKLKLIKNPLQPSQRPLGLERRVWYIFSFSHGFKGPSTDT